MSKIVKPKQVKYVCDVCKKPLKGMSVIRAIKAKIFFFENPKDFEVEHICCDCWHDFIKWSKTNQMLFCTKCKFYRSGYCTKLGEEINSETKLKCLSIQGE